MKTFRKITALLLMIALVLSGAAFAATPEEIADQTYLGMEWLAGEQAPNGSWGIDYEDSFGRTGLALLKFETHALHDPDYGTPFDPDYPFYDTVVTGLDYLLEQAQPVAITVQPAGDPDTNGNGLGATLFPGDGHNIYITSIALMAVAGSGDPDQVVSTGPCTGMTYGELAQDMTDYLSWAQNDTGTSRGGWGYQGNNVYRSDNSISGYAVLGLAFAEHPDYGFECVVPAFVKDELSIWIDYIQSDTTGGSGYHMPDYWDDLLKTGNLLQQMSFVGDPVSAPRVQAALGYIEDHWNDPIGAYPYFGWRGDAVSNYQATFALMKGLMAYGIDVIDVGGDPAFDWFNDFADELLPEQLPDNSWPQAAWDTESNAVLSTTWALLTLQKVAPTHSVREIDIDIRPGTIKNVVNPKEMGVLQIAVLGREDFPVKNIDPRTLYLTMEGKEAQVQPVGYRFADFSPAHGPHIGDGYCDLLLYFTMEDVLTVIQPDLEPVMELMIIGQDLDGISFEGTDVIYLTAPKTLPPSFRR